MQLSTGTEEPEGVLPSARHRTKQPNQLSFDVRPLLWKITGADLTQIHGFGPYLALKFVAECGTDMNRWPDASHFTSWLCLSPGNKISGGKVLSSKTRRSSSRIAAALRLAATTIGRSDTALGAFIVDYHPVSGKQKQSLQRQENWQYCSTMPLNTVRNMSITARIIMKSATVIAYSTGLNEGQNHWVTLSSKIPSYACEPGVSQ